MPELPRLQKASYTSAPHITYTYIYIGFFIFDDILLGHQPLYHAKPVNTTNYLKRAKIFAHYR